MNQQNCFLQLKPINLTTEDINVEELKFTPIMDQTGTFTYNCSKVIAEYSKPLYQNEHSIKDVEMILEMLRDLPPLNNDEYISYDVIVYSQTSR